MLKLTASLVVPALIGTAMAETTHKSALVTLRTRGSQIQIDGRGFVMSIKALQSSKEYSPAGHPSPLLSLFTNGRLVYPASARLDSREHKVNLKYPQGSIATIDVSSKDRYFRFQLTSLTNRSAIDNVVWGPLHTTVSKTIGDLIGVVRDDHWAIGMIGLDDNTIAGPPTDGDCYGMGYYIHSPDPVRFPIPPQYKEGQWFNIGGDGVSDTAFYSHPEEYFQQVVGNGAKLEPAYGSTLTYNARNRRKSYTHLFSLLPGFKGSRPRHQVSDPVDADYIGSAIALYACPDEQGLKTIGQIELAEGVPHPMIDGKWIHDPSGYKPDIAWYGPHDRMIEYADQLGLKAVQDEGQGEYYANPVDHWSGRRVGFAGSKSLTFPEFTKQTNQHGIKYGLHTLCLFLQPGRCTDVTPHANTHLQTVLRTKLAKSITPTDTDIEVTDPSYLSEDGTWPMRDGANTLRIGNELMTYTGVSQSSPYVFQGIKRGQYGTSPQGHRVNEELAKLQMNCYNGFVPDMALMPTYADYYAKVMVENGMEYIDFDGLESCVYQNHGYFGVRKFLRRLFETYGKLTGGRSPRVMGSCVFAGGWEFMSVCNVGGGNNMFDPVLNRWGIEGKDIRNGFGNSYFAATFGIQDLHSDWSLYDAENLEAKSIGWNAMYMLGLSQEAVEKCGEKLAIFHAIHTWENARQEQIFTPRVKEMMKDMNSKFHLEQNGKSSFSIFPIQEIRVAKTNTLSITNSHASQILQFTIRVSEAVDGCTISLPQGDQVDCPYKINPGQFVIFNSSGSFLADSNRREIARLKVSPFMLLPKGTSRLSVQFTGGSSATAKCDWTAWIIGKKEKLGSP